MKKTAVVFTILLGLHINAQTIDLQLLKAINQTDHKGWDKAMEYTSASVYPAMVIAPGTLLITGLVTKDKGMVHNGIKTVIALGTTIIITTGLKYAAVRQRPYDAYPYDIIKRASESSYSFPSGHTSAAFSLATSVTLSTKKWYAAVPCYAYAGLVGYSRMRLGVHYPSDVLAGALIGVGSSLLVWKIDKWINRRKTKTVITP